MTRWLTLAALALFACGEASVSYIGAPAEETETLRDAAAANWAAAGVDAPTDYVVAYAPTEEMAAECHVNLPAGTEIGACSFPGAVILNADHDFAMQLQDLTHELGHMMRPRIGKNELDHSHPSCPEAEATGGLGPDVMCPHNAAIGTLPTAHDVAFIRAR